MSRRYFSLDEADALLDKVRPMMRDVLAARQKIVDAQPELWPVLEKAIGNGGSRKAGDLLSSFETIQRNVRSLQELGVEVKDINQGLVDFLARRDGHDVYLCWRYDEPRITHWHELDTGFAGRQPL
jgi:hypothetical protein